jgi:hypothetical protein
MVVQGTTDRSAAEAVMPDSDRSAFAVVLVVNAVALVAFTGSPYAAEYPMEALGIGAFLLVQLLLPACRPVCRAPLCPGNIAQAFFWVQLVLVALLIGYCGIHEGSLPRMPSRQAIDTAVYLRVLGYLAFSIAYQLCSGSARRSGRDDGPQESPTPASGTPLLIGAFLAFGLAGQFLAYENLASFVEFVSSPASQRDRGAEPATPAAAAATFLRPFFGFGLVLLWSWWLQRKDRSRSVPACATATAGLVVLLLLTNFSYNRGSMVAPVVAVVAAYSVHIRRVSFLAVGLAGTVVLFAALAFGWYRSTDLEIHELRTADLRQTWSADQVTEFFQVYASGPQMTAFLIDERGDGSPLYWGRTMVCSVLYPVPVLGKAFREESGVGILNRLIYRDPEIVDQIIAYDAELYINFHVPGVVVGYALLGCAVLYVQGRFRQARQAVESYAWLILALWLVFPGSLPVMSQMCVYFFWPVYGYFAFKRWARVSTPAPANVPTGQDENAGRAGVAVAGG